MGRRNTNVARSRPRQRNTCSGTGTVPVDASDLRKGERSCGKCGGTGELS